MYHRYTQIQRLGWRPAHFRKVRSELYVFAHKVGEKPSAGEALVPRERQPSALTSVCASGQAWQLPCAAWSSLTGCTGDSHSGCLPATGSSPPALTPCQGQRVGASSRRAVPSRDDPCSPLAVTGGYRDFPPSGHTLPQANYSRTVNHTVVV